MIYLFVVPNRPQKPCLHKESSRRLVSLYCCVPECILPLMPADLFRYVVLFPKLEIGHLKLLIKGPGAFAVVGVSLENCVNLEAEGAYIFRG